MSEQRTITTLDKLNMLTDFLERKGLWKDEYPIGQHNFKMNFYFDEFDDNSQKCGTVGCIAGHMMRDEIWKGMGLHGFSYPMYKENCSIDALVGLLGINKLETLYIFYGSTPVYYRLKAVFYTNGTCFPKTVQEAIERINEVKENYN